MKDVLQVLPNSRMDSERAGCECVHASVFDAPAVLRLWHLASLDAPSVALVWSLAFAWVVHVRLPLWVSVLLTLTVWSVYVIDRLLDARSALRSAALYRLRERHLFHWRHRRILLPLATAAAAAAACMVFTLMPPIARERNSILAAASLVYFTRVHTGHELSPLIPRLLSKELLVGLLFTAGCVLPAFSRVTIGATFPTRSLIAPLLIPAVLFTLLAWLNCHAIDHWESNPPSANRFSIRSLAILLALASLLVAAVLGAHPRSAVLLIAGSAAALLLALLDRLRSRLTPVALRAAADLVLLTPALLLTLK
jgi:hypothetical protein